MCLTCSLINPFGGDWLHAADEERTIDESTLPGGDAPNSADPTVQLEAGDTFNGSLGSAGDWDWFYVEYEAGVTYTITMTPGTLDDPLIWFVDANGVFSEPVDFAFSGGTETITLTAPETGSGYIIADSYWNNIDFANPSWGSDTGTYTLTITEGGTPPPPPPPSSDNPLDSIDGLYTAPSVIDVYFVPGGVTFNDGTSQVTSAWDAFDQQQAMLAFQLYSNVANVTFNVVTNPNDAEFFMIESTDPDSPLGYWWVGGRSVTVDGVSYTPDGIGVHYSGGTGWDSDGLQQGGFGFITLIHEIGHGMGLMHPHDTGNGSTIMSGVTSPLNDLGDFDLNQGIYTTMTYNDGWQTAPHGTSPSANFSYGYQGTPMAFDIAVLQATYGANMTFNAGDDSYVLPTVNGIGTFYSAIWDADGTDTIVHNGSTGAMIDLRSAPLTYSENGGGYVSYVTGIHGGFTIAAGAVIENATGGSGQDTIMGNAENNLILGQQGSDSIMGGDGDDELRGNLNGDTIHGDAGSDLIYGNLGFDSLYGGSFADTVYGGNQDDQIWGEGGQDLLVGQTGNDTIWGGDGFDLIRGGADDDLLYGGDRGDTLIGGIGNDTVYGDDGNDRLDGNDGDDLLEGGAGQDNLFGGAGADTLLAGEDNDRIFAGTGDDLIDGGTGNDTIFGAGGVDTFVFGPDFGDDVIRDFDPNGELIDLTALPSGFLMSIGSVAGGTLVTTSQGTILLEGVDVSDVTMDDFLL